MICQRSRLDRVKHHLERPCKLAGTPWSEVETAVETYHAQIWSIEPGCVAAIATKVTEDGACDIWLSGGKGVTNWFALAEREVTAFAKRHGCDRLRIIGRKGWKRVLPHWVDRGVDDGLIVLELPA